VVPGSKKVEEKVEEEKMEEEKMEEEKMEEEKMVEESGGRKVPVFTDDPNGFSYLGMVPEKTQALMNEIYFKMGDRFGQNWENRLKEIFWINFYQANERSKEWAGLSGIDEFEKYAFQLFNDWYDPETDDFDGYGFIVNPIGSKTQSWHLDYQSDYSSIFIPMCPLTPNNATQYVVIPKGDAEARKNIISLNPDAIDLDELVKKFGFLSVRQMVTKPFSVLKMEFDAIHRGVSNTGTFSRIVFWLSVRKKSSSPTPVEDVFQIFEGDIGDTQTDYRKGDQTLLFNIQTEKDRRYDLSMLSDDQ